MSSLFAAVEMAPRDPILGLNEQFNADPNPAKVNLGVGVYFDDTGKLPLLECVFRFVVQMPLPFNIRILQTIRPTTNLPRDTFTF